MQMLADTRNWRDIYFTSRDGLRLYARHYPVPGSSRRAVLCLPGLTRNCRDFHELATRLSDPRGHRREVFAVDYRGRGLSEHDPEWRNYSPLVECLDVLDLLTLQGVRDIAVIGTSRGGLIAMIMAALRPAVVRAVVLNDVGPVIEPEGLARIIGFVGRVPLPESWEAAAALVREINQAQFPNVPAEEWMAVARHWFNDENGLPSPSYDPNLGKTISSADLTASRPDMWPQFQGLARVPVLALRGEHSDMLSEATLQRMASLHPMLMTHTVRGQGHAPLLRDEATQQLISNFLVRLDGQTAQTGLRAVA